MEKATKREGGGGQNRKTREKLRVANKRQRREKQTAEKARQNTVNRGQPDGGGARSPSPFGEERCISVFGQGRLDWAHDSLSDQISFNLEYSYVNLFIYPLKEDSKNSIIFPRIKD